MRGKYISSLFLSIFSCYAMENSEDFSDKEIILYSDSTNIVKIHENNLPPKDIKEWINCLPPFPESDKGRALQAISYLVKNNKKAMYAQNTNFGIENFQLISTVVRSYTPTIAQSEFLKILAQYSKQLGIKNLQHVFERYNSYAECLFINLFNKRVISKNGALRDIQPQIIKYIIPAIENKLIDLLCTFSIKREEIGQVYLRGAPIDESGNYLVALKKFIKSNYYEEHFYVYDITKRILSDPIELRHVFHNAPKVKLSIVPNTKAEQIFIYAESYIELTTKNYYKNISFGNEYPYVFCVMPDDNLLICKHNAKENSSSMRTIGLIESLDETEPVFLNTKAFDAHSVKGFLTLRDNRLCLITHKPREVIFLNANFISATEVTYAKFSPDGTIILIFYKQNDSKTICSFWKFSSFNNLVKISESIDCPNNDTSAIWFGNGFFSYFIEEQGLLIKVIEKNQSFIIKTVKSNDFSLYWKPDCSKLFLTLEKELIIVDIEKLISLNNMLLRGLTLAQILLIQSILSPPYYKLDKKTSEILTSITGDEQIFSELQDLLRKLTL